MLNVDDARSIAADWRERFTDEAAFELSWTRYFESATVPDRTRLEAWLAKDLSKDAIKHAGIVKEPLFPTRQRTQLGDCPACFIPGIGSPGFIRQDVGIDHPNFGKAIPCRRCNS